MDELKRYMKEIAKYSFWIITALVLILSSVIFFITKGSLDTSISQRISSLNGSFTKINDLGSKAPTHPNETSHKEMQIRLDNLITDVDQAWQFQYERQKEFFTWPQNAFQYPKVQQIFDSLRPFEKKVPFPAPEKWPEPLDQITVRDREVYKGYIEPEFPALAKRIGSTWKFNLDAKGLGEGGEGGPGIPGGFGPPGGGGGFAPPGLGGGTGPAVKPADSGKDLVRWSEAAQKELLATAMPWFSKTIPPTIHEIYYTQEDIWLLRGLMDIIATANSDAKENFQAVVREIEWIRWGSRASRDAGSLGSGDAAAGGMGGGPMGMSMGGGPPAGYSGGGGGGAPAGYGGMGMGGGKPGFAAPAAARAVDPADGRYVDTSFKPLTGSQLRGAMNLQNANDAVIGVAKRIPVRLRLKIDESQLGRLITECGNGKMMLEVLQVRYNTDPAPAVGSAPAGGGGVGMPGSMGPPGGAAAAGTGGGAGASLSGGEGEGEGEGAGGGMGGMFGGMGGGKGAFDSNGEVAVEVFGMVYMFNPPANLKGTNTNGAAPAGVANGAGNGDAAASNGEANGTGTPNGEAPATNPAQPSEPTTPKDPNAPNEPNEPTAPGEPSVEDPSASAPGDGNTSEPGSVPATGATDPSSNPPAAPAAGGN